MAAALPAPLTIYSIDSSSLIYCRKHYPIDIFPSLWQGLGQLAKEGRLIAHEEVWIEISQRVDFMTAWAVSYQNQLSIVATAVQIATIQLIARDYPLAAYTTTTEHRADPWVVALARENGCAVISLERGNAQPFPKIPQMCLKYGVQHFDIWDVIRAEQWTY